MSGWMFDRSALGHETAPLSWPVERGRVAALCGAIGETDPVHFDEEAARTAGYSAIVAPPTFAQVIDEETRRLAIRCGERTVLEMIGADLRRLLHGSEGYDIHAPMLAGDVLTIRHRVEGFELRRKGTLDVARVTSDIAHSGRGPVMTVRRTYLHLRPRDSA